MAKKSRRTRAKRRAESAKVVQEKRSQEPRPTPAELKPPVDVSPKAQDFASRYEYVIPEVKRIGIIAGAILVVLIILAFLLG